jgi:hypothetical protein
LQQRSVDALAAGGQCAHFALHAAGQFCGRPNLIGLVALDFKHLRQRLQDLGEDGACHQDGRFIHGFTQDQVTVIQCVK